MVTGETPLGVLAEVVPAGAALGFYVHVPFCVQRCHYCSFTTAPLEDPGQPSTWLRAVTREIALLSTAPLNAGQPEIATVFLGGGTPSLLAPAQIAAVLDVIRTRFRVAPDAEVTVEANPESADRGRLAGYRRAGVNRLSLGVQALDDGLLRVLGRLHDAAGARAAFTAAREAGFTNVSVDLMYGLPGLDLDGWRRTVRAILAWQPDHLSAYGLTLDAGSLWGATGVPGLPGEETAIAQYRTLCDEAAHAGLEHYEISNWARPGFRSRHNQIYWRRQEYLAAGPGACGFVGEVRWSNVKAFSRYVALLEQGRLPVDGWERLTDGQALAETLILGLRTADGVATARLAERLAGDPPLARRVDDWRERGLLEEAGGRTRLTPGGFLLSDALFVELA